jgi:hypothetical protein
MPLYDTVTNTSIILNYYENNNKYYSLVIGFVKVEAKSVGCSSHFPLDKHRNRYTIIQ